MTITIYNYEKQSGLNWSIALEIDELIETYICVKHIADLDKNKIVEIIPKKKKERKKTIPKKGNILLVVDEKEI